MASELGSSEAQKLLDQVLKLPVAARAELAERLLRSLDDEDDEGRVSADEYNAAWGAELARRIKEIEDGTVKLIPWDEARRRIASDE
jgi:putative addiction module component (TIGR02574 family)